jgi:hypothetical protein
MKEAQEEEERRRQQEQQAKQNKLPGVWATQTAAAPAPVAGPTLAEIQAQEAKKKEEQKKAEISSANANTLKSLLGLNAAGVPAAGGSGWKTEAVKPATGKPSLKDIMQSEAQQTIETSKDVPRSSAASWAAKLGIGSSLGSGPQPAQTINEEKSSSSSSKPSTGRNTSPVDIWNQQSGELKSIPSKGSTAVTSGNTSKNKDDFGGSGMTSEMVDWCQAQLKKISGSDDMTLAELCMSCESSVDIREYMASYLGSTPQVSAFATEFIKRKETIQQSSGFIMNTSKSKKK